MHHSPLISNLQAIFCLHSKNLTNCFDAEMPRFKKPFCFPLEKPVITRVAGQTVVPQASDLVLTCEVKGIPLPSITWYFKGNVLVATTDSRIVTGTYNSVRVKYVHGLDAGQYRCVAKNDAGTDSRQVTVIVRGQWLHFMLIFFLTILESYMLF